MGSEYQSLAEIPAPEQGLPNWYPDPLGQGAYRYWNGERWTEAFSASANSKPSKAARQLSTGQLAPLPGAIPVEAHIAATNAGGQAATAGAVQPGQAGPPQYVYVKNTGNGMAVAGLVCGIIGALVGLIPILFIGAWILGILGLIFGFIGRNRANDNPEVGRKTMATWAVILGVVAIGLGILGVVIVNNAANDLNDSLNETSHELREDEQELNRELRQDEREAEREEEKFNRELEAFE